MKNIDIAEDLAQDTFVYVLTKRKKYDFKYTLKSYLYTIAKCRALNYIKKEKKIIKLDDSYMEDLEYEKSIEELYIKKEEKKYILNIINKLKPQYKEVILLREIDELRYDEISKVLKKSIPQIKILIHRARKNLEKIIREENIVC